MTKSITFDQRAQRATTARALRAHVQRVSARDTDHRFNLMVFRASLFTFVAVFIVWL